MLHLRHGLCAALFLSLTLALSACGGGAVTSVEESATQEGTEASSEATTSEEQASEDAADEGEGKLTSATQPPEPATEPAEEEEQPKDSTEAALDEFTQHKRVGQVGIGFCDIPNYYVDFVDVDGNDSLQYSNSSGTDIVSLNVIDLSSLPEDQRASFTAERAAQNLWANIEYEGATDIQGARVSLGGHEAYQVYGTYPNGTILVMWVVADYEGTLRYVAVESPVLENVVELVSLVENSYGFDK